MADASPQLLTSLARNWWAFVVRGTIAVIFGLVAWFWPGLALYSLILLFAVYATSGGLLSIVAALRSIEARERWIPLLLEGVIGVGAGVVAIAWPDLAAKTFLYLIAIWAIASGVLEIIAAIRLQKEIDNEWLLGLTGLAGIVFGVIAILRPLSGALAVLWLIGLTAIIVGLLLIVLGWRLRNIDRLRGAGGTAAGVTLAPQSSGTTPVGVTPISTPSEAPAPATDPASPSSSTTTGIPPAAPGVTAANEPVASPAPPMTRRERALSDLIATLPPEGQGWVRGDGTTTAPAGYPLKGNINSRIYHAPGGQSYDETTAEVHFATDDDALGAGFRPRKEPDRYGIAAVVGSDNSGAAVLSGSEAEVTADAAGVTVIGRPAPTAVAVGASTEADELVIGDGSEADVEFGIAASMEAARSGDPVVAASHAPPTELGFSHASSGDPAPPGNADSEESVTLAEETTVSEAAQPDELEASPESDRIAARMEDTAEDAEPTVVSSAEAEWASVPNDVADGGPEPDIGGDLIAAKGSIEDSPASVGDSDEGPLGAQDDSELQFSGGTSDAVLPPAFSGSGASADLPASDEAPEADQEAAAGADDVAGAGEGAGVAGGDEPPNEPDKLPDRDVAASERSDQVGFDSGALGIAASGAATASGTDDGAADRDEPGKPAEDKTSTVVTASKLRTNPPEAREREKMSKEERQLEDLIATLPAEGSGWVKGDGTYFTPKGYPVKGNASSMLYHMPGGRNYPATIPEICFATADDARAAGFRPRSGDPTEIDWSHVEEAPESSDAAETDASSGDVELSAEEERIRELIATLRPQGQGWVRGDGSYSCPAGYEIKGNESSRIYHVPGGQNFDDTIPELCFATTADAEKAGFRARTGDPADGPWNKPATAEQRFAAIASTLPPEGYGWVRGDETYDTPPGYSIKGNESSRIYHVPGGQNYNDTIPEFCFSTTADAEEAGFRARKGDPADGPWNRPATQEERFAAIVSILPPEGQGWVLGDGSYSCPAGYEIKGNESSRIFHVPGGQNYDDTIPEFCFATTEAALAARFRKRTGDPDDGPWNDPASEEERLAVLYSRLPPEGEGWVRGDGSYNCAAGFEIKGNEPSRIYHVATGASYDVTIPEFCFADESVAEQAGFRKARN